MSRLVRRKKARRGARFELEVPPLIDVLDRQRQVRVPRRKLERAIRAALALKPRKAGPVSIALVDDRAIRRLHREHLGLDTATDVLSFPLHSSPGGLLGEVVASAETARREASQRGIPPAEELLLYVVHGVLHLLGFDDHAAAARKKMRSAERLALRAAGVRRDLFLSRD